MMPFYAERVDSASRLHPHDCAGKIVLHRAVICGVGFLLHRRDEIILSAGIKGDFMSRRSKHPHTISSCSAGPAAYRFHVVHLRFSILHFIAENYRRCTLRAARFHVRAATVFGSKTRPCSRQEIVPSVRNTHEQAPEYQVMTTVNH